MSEHHARVTDKRILETPDGGRKIHAWIEVVNEGGEIVGRTQFGHRLAVSGLTQADIQARLDEAKNRALTEAEVLANIDLEALE